MKVDYSNDFISTLKKKDVRIHKSFRERIAIFQNNPQDSVLNNHALRAEWERHRSIDITSDFRAIYKETRVGQEIIAYFVRFGTHEELYG